MSPFQRNVSAGRDGDVAVRDDAVTRHAAVPEATRAPVPDTLGHVLKKVHGPGPVSLVQHVVFGARMVFETVTL